MEELILIVLRVFFAILWGLLEAGVYIPFDFGYDKAANRFPTWAVLILYFAIGCAVGGASLFVLPSAQMKTPTLRVITLFASPIFGGIIGVITATLIHDRPGWPQSQKHFWPGFLFALGLSTIRFTYCSR
jgi:hypothetical protein